jgi:hypothetical protein
MAGSKDQQLDKAGAFLLRCFIATVAAAPSANAADVAGKWYRKLESEPVISIAKAGPQYTASLDYPESSRQIVQGIHSFRALTDTSLVSFRVADGNGQDAHHSISQRLVGWQGDIVRPIEDRGENHADVMAKAVGRMASAGLAAALGRDAAFRSA